MPPSEARLPSVVRYASVGVFATLVHYLTLVASVQLAAWPAWLGSGIGAFVGAQAAYLGNRRFTFAHRGAIGASWSRFMLTAALGGAWGMAVVALGVTCGLHYLVAQVIATLSAMLLTFGVNRAWTFR